MTDIEIYTHPGCGYCTAAKKLLTQKQLPFIEFDVADKPEYLAEMRNRTSQKTFPQIFIAGESIGGFNDLLRFEQLHTLGNPN